MELAVREGVDAVSIRRIASACAISIGSVYNYYTNKETLVSDVASRFWNGILMDQEKLYHDGMRFTMFLEQYYLFLYGRLSQYDKSWLMGESGQSPAKNSISLFYKALEQDAGVNRSIWNMELNEKAFCQYVMTNVIALLREGESNCRFFVFLLEHLLYGA